MYVYGECVGPKNKDNKKIVIFHLAEKKKQSNLIIKKKKILFFVFSKYSVSKVYKTSFEGIDYDIGWSDNVCFIFHEKN